MWKSPVLCALAMTLFTSSAARAEEGSEPIAPADPLDIVSAVEVLDRALSAAVTPNAPVVSLGWVGSLRASVGLPIVIYAERPGWIVRLSPLVELYDRDTFGGFPYEYWRGVLGLEVGHRHVLAIDGGALALSGALSLDHESDHETVNTVSAAGPMGRYSTFLYTNAVSLHGDAALVLDELSLAARLTVGTHVFSCTRADLACDLDAGTGGQSAALALDVVLRTGASDDRDRIQLCGAIHGGWTASAGRMIEEARLRAQAGPCVRFTGVGEWSLLAQLALGSATGMQRGHQEVTAGGVVRWSP